MHDRWDEHSRRIEQGDAFVANLNITGGSGWIADDWKAVIVEHAGDVACYILFQRRSDEFRPADTTVCVRQFFIWRELRSRGLGWRPFDMVTEANFSNASAVVLDVLETNPRTRRFWEALGFQPYSTAMQLAIALRTESR